MAYCTVADIEKMIPAEAIIQLTDDEGANSVNTGRVNEAITQSDAEIDSYCATRGYVVPFSPIPDIVKKMSVDIAIYNLYSRRVEQIPETRAERYKNAMRQLEGIAKGAITLGEVPEPEQVSGGFVKTNKSYNDRIFTSDTLKEF